MFILASSSPRRLALLADIGVVPSRVVAADIDETPMKNELPAKLAMRLAHAKLLTVTECLGAKEEGAWVLAADTVVACGRRVLPKAESAQEVAVCLRLLSGRRHRVMTGVALRTGGGRVLSRLVCSIVQFRQLSDHDIAHYVRSGEGLGKAGGYAIQGRAAAYIHFMSGSYSSVVGLPLYDVAQMLIGEGYPLGDCA